MYRINIRLLIISLAIFVVVLGFTLYYLVVNIQENSASNENTEQIYAQESISDKLKSNNEELLERVRFEKPKILVVLGTDERATEISRSDIIMVIRYDFQTNNALIVSIPRDTKVQIPGHKNDKINHAFAFGGAELSVKTIEGLFGITVDNYIRFGFEDFKTIVESFEGVEINAVKDFREDAIIRIPEGRQVLSGADALFYVRYRDDSEVDFGRIKRQQEVVKSLTNKISGLDREEMAQIIAKLYPEVVKTDLNIDEINGYLETINEMGNMYIQAVTLKTHSIKTNGIWYEEFTEKDLNEAVDLLKGEKNGTGIYRD